MGAVLRRVVRERVSRGPGGHVTAGGRSWWRGLEARWCWSVEADVVVSISDQMFPFSDGLGRRRPWT